MSSWERKNTERIGFAGPLGRERCLNALPTVGAWLSAHELLHDQDGCFLADPEDTLHGVAGVRVDRYLAVRWTEDTRRLAG